MPLEMGRLGAIIKASPAPCLLIHFTCILILGNQVSVKLLLVSSFSKQSSNSVELSTASGPVPCLALFIMGEGREENV